MCVYLYKNNNNTDNKVHCYAHHVVLGEICLISMDYNDGNGADGVIERKKWWSLRGGRAYGVVERD